MRNLFFAFKLASRTVVSVVAHAGTFIAMTEITTADTMAEIRAVPDVARLLLSDTIVVWAVLTTVGGSNRNIVLTFLDTAFTA